MTPEQAAAQANDEKGYRAVVRENAYLRAELSRMKRETVKDILGGVALYVALPLVGVLAWGFWG